MVTYLELYLVLRSVNTLVLLDLVELDGVVLWSVNTLALLDLVHSRLPSNEICIYMIKENN